MHNSLIETIWFVVPILIIIALAIPTVKTLYDYENHQKKTRSTCRLRSKCWL